MKAYRHCNIGKGVGVSAADQHRHTPLAKHWGVHIRVKCAYGWQRGTGM